MRPMNQYLQHPEEEALERFLLHQSSDEELDIVETHILACDSCVARLENLEVEIAATKLALQEMKNEEAARNYAQQPGFFAKWLALPRWSFAAACAALLLGIAIIPQMRHLNGGPTADVTLTAERGMEMTVLPKDRPLHVVLDANDLTQNTVKVDLVNDHGSLVWHGSAPVQNDHAVVNVPAINQAGEHYFRLYAPAPSGQGDLLREFAFNVK